MGVAGTRQTYYSFREFFMPRHLLEPPEVDPDTEDPPLQEIVAPGSPGLSLPSNDPEEDDPYEASWT